MKLLCLLLPAAFAATTLLGSCTPAQEPDRNEDTSAPADADTSGSDTAGDVPFMDVVSDAEGSTDEYAGQCEGIFDTQFPPVENPYFTREDQDRQCRFNTGCSNANWIPRVLCPDWNTLDEPWYCSACWNETCIALSAGGCPEPPYEQIVSPQSVMDCPGARPNRAEQPQEVLSALDRICSVADDCAVAGTGNTCAQDGADSYARCGACFQGRCEWVLSVVPCD
jgi:hypothetical protein